MNENYLDTKHKFNELNFDKNEFFNLISNILSKNKVPFNDLKANIYPQKLKKSVSWDKNLLKIKCVFNWFIYPEDVPQKEARTLANNIEKYITEEFHIDKNDDVCECIPYEYSERSGNGYDMDLKLYITYDYDES